ncbi:MAG: SDR family NAD(P)-dependent oxidoreductase [Deltaproteobacteria bacterium]|nr:SDR family NAD(P)-dependent oxidoreductase [Deltaproteobacteria bacterium]
MRFDDEFKERVVIVTGSAGGLGKETAVKYAEAGAKVVIADVKDDLGKQTADEINKKTGGKALFSRLDVTVESSVEEMVQNTIGAFGTVDILVNSARISPASPLMWTVVRSCVDPGRKYQDIMSHQRPD